jgi:hypothetical protein
VNHDRSGAGWPPHARPRGALPSRSVLTQLYSPGGGPLHRGVAFAATVYNVLSDTMPSRDAIEPALLSWDRDRSESSSAIMLPRRWETDAVPLSVVLTRSR